MDVHQVANAADQNSYPYDQTGKENNLYLPTVKLIPVLSDDNLSDLPLSCPGAL